jgi:hypothetical protein
MATLAKRSRLGWLNSIMQISNEFQTLKNPADVAGFSLSISEPVRRAPGRRDCWSA